MCGIVGYTGNREAYPVLLNGLERLEYRGYDSCGVAVQTDHGIEVSKETGTVERLRLHVDELQGHAGIGHTRWATVGMPTVANAHPHLDCRGDVAIVHNGDIDNFMALRERLLEQGHRFASDTDSEVLAHLIESYAADGPLESVVRALRDVEGSYALVAMHRGSGMLVAARRESPLVIGLGEGEQIVASDVPAVIESTSRVLYLEDGDLVRLQPEGVQVFHDDAPVHRSVHQISWRPQDLGKAGYDHYFLKEVHEGPRVIRDTLAGKIASTDPGVTLQPDLMALERPSRILLAGCGTAYYAGLLAGEFYSELSPCDVTVRIASELESFRPADASSWGIFITQSGETADTISAARLARNSGRLTIGVTNTPNSSITRLVEHTLETQAGPETSVAASKTFMAQVIDLYLLGLHLFPPSMDRLRDLLTELRLVPAKVQRVLGMEERLRDVGRMLAPREHVYLIAKGINYPVALEGALKLKELAYLHAEGYPAGELKHGPFAMLTPETPVIALVPKDRTYTRVLNAIKEIRARGAPVIAFTDTDTDDDAVASVVNELVRLPATDPLFFPVIATAALYLMAYHCARERGLPIDRPRHLAKSVTVH